MAEPLRNWCALAAVAAERVAQARVHGHTPADDDSYVAQELRHAAAAYCFASFGSRAAAGVAHDLYPRAWPPLRPWRFSERQLLVRAAALIVAEIERLDRAAAIVAEIERLGGGAAAAQDTRVEPDIRVEPDTRVESDAGAIQETGAAEDANPEEGPEVAQAAQAAQVAQAAQAPVPDDRYLLWLRGLRGPQPQVVTAEPGKPPPLDQAQRAALMAPPRLLNAADRGLRLDTLAALFYPPAPAAIEDERIRL